MMVSLIMISNSTVGKISFCWILSQKSSSMLLNHFINSFKAHLSNIIPLMTTKEACVRGRAAAIIHFAISSTLLLLVRAGWAFVVMRPGGSGNLSIFTIKLVYFIFDYRDPQVSLHSRACVVLAVPMRCQFGPARLFHVCVAPRPRTKST